MHSESRAQYLRFLPEGRNLITHAPGGHDDVENAAAGALVGVAKEEIERHFYAIG